MALISDAHQLIEFFSVKGEPKADPKRHRVVKGGFRLSSSSSSETEADVAAARKRARLRYEQDKAPRSEDCIDANYGNHKWRCSTQNLPSSSSSLGDREICDIIARRTTSAKARIRQHEQNSSQRARKVNTRSEMEGGSSGLQLVCFLLNCASAIADDKKALAASLLSQLYSRVNITGNSIERVAAHFADALAAKLKSRKPSQFMTPDEEDSQQFAAFTAFYRVSPLYQFAHLTANQAIIEAFEGKSHLHIIDMDISHGIQWASLIQSLSERKDLPNLRISGFGRDLNVVHATGNRLSSFAQSCGLTSFEFHPYLEGPKHAISAESLGIKQEETVAVNMVLYLNKLASSHNILYSRLRSIEALKPAVVALVEHEASHNPTTFLSRFMESLHYYAALFDSLDECLPLQSAERLRIERFHFGHQIINTIREEDVDQTRETHERWETWKARMERGGFVQMGLSCHCIRQAKLLLQARQPSTSFEGGGFRVDERDAGKMLSLAWQDRQLIAASVWRSQT